MNVSDYVNVTTEGAEDYFITLIDDTSTNFKARFFIKKVGKHYQLGLASSGSTTSNYATNLFNVGDMVFVTLGYDFTSNTLKAWLNPILNLFLNF